MTILTPSDSNDEGLKTSRDPLSSTSTTEWTIEDMMKSLSVTEDPNSNFPPVPVAREETKATAIANYPVPVAREETKATAIANYPVPVAREDTRTKAVKATRPIQERLTRDDICPPLLQAAEITQLPPRFQRLLKNDGDNARDPSIQFFQSRIPKLRPIFWFIPSLPLAALAWFGGSEYLYGNTAVKVAIVATIVVVPFLASLYYDEEYRKTVYAKDSNGVRKAWPGDWKIGVYLVGHTALLEYDGNNVMLFPMNTIAKVDCSEAMQETLLWIRTPSEKFQYKILYLENNFTMGRDIQKWQQNYIKQRTRESQALAV